MTLEWMQQAAQLPDARFEKSAIKRQAQLTKPPGALGQLESIAIRLAALQKRDKPGINTIHICVFAADHGVAAQGVSAFPQAVTTEMVKNFATGGAAISVLAKHHQAQLNVINLGTIGDTSSLESVTTLNLAAGTKDFTQTEAMSHQQLEQAIQAGRESLDQYSSSADDQPDLFIGGEMGIGNTSSATALACAVLKLPASIMTGPGTGLDNEGIAHKIKIIEQGLSRHQKAFSDPLETLRCLGGFEIAALVGAYIHCAQKGIVVLVDGFISSVAALVATKINPQTAPWLIYAHQSAEPGHQQVLKALNAKPLLNLGMRLGEGSGAAAAIPLLQQACALHNEMATFAEASVSNKGE